ncbi:hypothetical protein GGH98_003112, partial [Coemansia sp. RSA 454]
HAPGFPLSSTLDAVLAMVPHLSDHEAHVISGLLCSAVLSTAAHMRAGQYAAAERASLATARRKKTDEVASDSGADIESDSE